MISTIAGKLWAKGKLSNSSFEEKGFPAVHQYVPVYTDGMCNVCGIDSEGIFWHAGEDGVVQNVGYVHDAEYADEPRVYELQPYVNLWILSDSEYSILFVQGSDAEIMKGIERSKQAAQLHRVK